MILPIHTLDDIRSRAPCYDPVRYAPDDWTGTALDVLMAGNVPAEDRLWVVLCEDWIDPRTLRLFAVWCAREALKLIDNPDPRSVSACDIAERFVHGEANDDELAAARDAARDAAWDATWDSASDAALDTTRDSAMDAALYASVDAIRAAPCDAQVNRLIEMLEE